jgi:hypothetical protein
MSHIAVVDFGIEVEAVVENTVEGMMRRLARFVVGNAVGIALVAGETEVSDIGIDGL